jgi:hypothetical protein
MQRTPQASAEIRLSGEWQFQIDPTGDLTPTTIHPDRAITVPLPWQAAFPELRSYSGFAWYRHEFIVDSTFLAGDVRLHFGAVDYWCQVFVNDTYAGEHEGGYTPFSFLVGTLLRPGPNTVAVRVYDSAQAAIVTARWPSFNPVALGANSAPPFNAEHIPHGKQEWYINVGGIWQDVTLTALPRASVERIHVTPHIERGTAALRVRLAGDLGEIAGRRCLLSVIDGEETVASTSIHLVAGQRDYEAELAVPAPRLWSLDDPHLYFAQAVIDLGVEQAVHSVRFGMRSFTARNGQFLLNGEPIFLLSALDQDLYPDTIYTVPSEEYLRDQFGKAKELGLNNLRCHIKPPDPLYLDLADEMGLLVWAEIPSWRTFWNKGTYHSNQLDLPRELKARVEATLEAMVERDFNHPSLVIWTLVNEDWGTSLPLSAADRAWVKELYDQCKRLDPTRLAVDNSACPHAWGPNVHVKSDIDDFHLYAAIPDQARTMARSIRQLALRPMWSYSMYGDAQRRGDEPLVLSEFGNWGMPSLAALRRHHGGEPPWFDTGPWWSRWEGEPGWPAGVEERFNRLGLDKIWDDYEAFAHATQMHQFEAMKFEIEAMRREPAIAGYVVTEFTDAYWESNGLLDFARNPKAYHDSFRMINSPDVVVAMPRRYAFWAGEQPTVSVYVSHYSGGAREGASLRWQVEGTELQGGLSLAEFPLGSTRRVCTLRFTLPDVPTARTVRLALTLVDPHGTTLAHNVLDLAVYPAAARHARLDELVAVIGQEREEPFSPDLPALVGASAAEGAAESIAEAAGMAPEESEGSYAPLDLLLEEAGYRTTDRLDSDVKLAISNSPTAELLAWVRDGGDLLYLAEGPSPFFWVQSRSLAYSGGWITSYTWLRAEAHARLQPANPLGLAYTNVMPRNTILGVPMDDPAFHADILAGMVSGWVHHPAAHTVQFRFGLGRVIMTTFRLKLALGYDPAGTAMLHDLVDYLHSDRCQPALQANY